MLNFYKFHNKPELLDNNHIAIHIDKIIEYEFDGVHEIAMPIIKRSSGHATHYAVKYLNSRFIDAEPVIMKDPYSAFLYAEQVIKGRWLEAEPYIIKEYKAMIYYVRDVIKGRWPEAEDLIKSTGSYWDWKWYCNCLDIND
jgi:hypothetical protein